MKIILLNAKTKTENNHPGPNPHQGLSHIPQGTQKKVTGESAKKSGHPSAYTISLTSKLNDLRVISGFTNALKN